MALVAILAASASGTVSGTTHKVSGILDFEGVDCPAQGACIAVGETPRNSKNFSTGAFVTISGGKPGAAQTVAGTNLLNRVACPSDHLCIATGSVFGRSQHAVYVVIDHGNAGQVHNLPIDGAASIGCGSASSCWVAGENFPAAGGSSATPMLVHLVNQQVAKTYTLTGTYSFSAGESGGAMPFCDTATSCILVGTSGFQGTPQGLIFSMDKGKVTILHHVPGTSALSGLWCTSSTFCRIVGDTQQGESEQGDVLTLDSGGVGKIHTVKPSTFPLACVDKKSCFTFGSTFVNNQSTNYIVPIDGGVPGTPQKVTPFITSATCRSSACLGVGFIGSFPNQQGEVFSFQG